MSVFSVSIIIVMATISYGALQLNDAKYRIFASRYGEELAEWLKYQRELQEGYDNLYAKISVSPYCFNNLDIDIDINNWPVAEACSDYSLNGFYKRELQLSVTADPNVLAAEITTSWQLLQFTKEVKITEDFHNYEP